MTLTLLVAKQAPAERPVLLADPLGRIVHALLDSLTAPLGRVERLVFPLPDDTTRRHEAPPSLIRSRHSDLWHALDGDERRRVVLAAGPTAGYLGPAVEGGTTMIVAVPHPTQAAARRMSAWRSIVGAFPELDEIPDELESVTERAEWLDRLKAATSNVELIRATDTLAVATAVAAGLGLGLRPKAADRAARIASAGATRHREEGARSTHWLDEALYSITPDRRERPRDSAPA
jgi:hypothetical protein